MVRWPSWNSLEDVSRVHSISEGVGIAILFLLGFAEIVSMIYNHQRDRLQSQVDLKRQEEIARLGLETARLSNDAETAKASIARANADAAVATARAAEANLALEKYKAPRRLTADQVRHVTNALKRFAGTPFDMEVSQTGDAPGLAVQLADLLQSAGWVWKDNPGSGSIVVRLGNRVAAVSSYVGFAAQIEVTKAGQWKAALDALVSEMNAQGIPMLGNVVRAGETRTDTVQIVVGAK